MLKPFNFKIEESLLEKVKVFSEEKKVSMSDIFKLGAELYISGDDDRIKALEEEIVCLKDTLEAGADSTDFGFIPELNKAVSNLVKRLHKCRSASHAHFARVINRWSANTIHASVNTTEMNRAPLVESPKD